MRLRIEYFDQNASFERCLPVTGQGMRVLKSVSDARSWWVVQLDKPLEYQLRVGEPYQYRLLRVRDIVIGTRLEGQQVGEASPAHVHIYLPLSEGATDGPDMNASLFYHAAWGTSSTEDAAKHGFEAVAATGCPAHCSELASAAAQLKTDPLDRGGDTPERARVLCHLPRHPDRLASPSFVCGA
jgi:hypothetical protein